jgi:predicted 3-demethylubiquinone-9 3-methyltransferase (glyoxalase superfamily)
MKPIYPFLWFDSEAEEAAKFYTTIFKNSKIKQVVNYPKSVAEEGGGPGGKPEGSVMTVSFEINGQDFMAINGGTHFKINQAISFMVPCETQEELDRMWDKLAEGGQIQQCGWLLDKYGVAWQLIPHNLDELVNTPEKAERVMAEVIKMIKLDIKTLEQASRGKTAAAA